MPYEASTFHLPCGARAARVQWHGPITAEAAARAIKLTGPGGELYGLPLLVLTAEVPTIDPGARSGFASRPDNASWTAVVVTNPVMRVSTNFIARMNRARRLRTFRTEQEAIQWLDERVREAQAPTPGG